MIREETMVIMGILKTAYPDYYKTMKRDEAEKTVALWTELLEPYPLEICAFAVKRLISESPYVPKISEVISRIKETIKPEENSAADAWNILRNIVCRASVVTKEEFEKLPYEIKRFCGGLSGLRDMGRIETDILNTVTRGQFMKAYDGIKRSRETMELMPPEIRELSIRLAKELSMPKTERALIETR